VAFATQRCGKSIENCWLLRSVSRVLDGLAIGPPGQKAILELLVAIKFLPQEPSDHEYEHDNAKGDQRSALIAVSAITIRHALFHRSKDSSASFMPAAVLYYRSIRPANILI
jgi:hypothetical protein